MAQTPNQRPIDIISVPSSTVGPNTQETLNYQHQVENYSGPPIIHGSPRPDNESAPYAVAKKVEVMSSYKPNPYAIIGFDLPVNLMSELAAVWQSCLHSYFLGC
eukprot:2451134-Amphidinium_carterae.1